MNAIQVTCYLPLLDYVYRVLPTATPATKISTVWPATALQLYLTEYVLHVQLDAKHVLVVRFAQYANLCTTWSPMAVRLALKAAPFAPFHRDIHAQLA